MATSFPLRSSPSYLRPIFRAVTGLALASASACGSSQNGEAPSATGDVSAEGGESSSSDTAAGGRDASSSGGESGSTTTGSGGLAGNAPAREPRLGDPGWVLDTSRYDERFPDALEFAKAGVEGGIPYRETLAVAARLSPGDAIQGALDEAARDAAAGDTELVVLLEPGSYDLEETLEIPSGVVLRGEDESSVVLRSLLRAPDSDKKATLLITNAERAGVEDLTIHFIAPSGMEPVDFDTFDTPTTWCSTCWENLGQETYVYGVSIKESQNCWVDGVTVFESGTNPVAVDAKSTHNTLRSTTVDRCYNKGGGGNCYFDVRGAHQLVVYNDVRRIRHFAVQQQAIYAVVTENHLEVDVNFHNKDLGHNLIEGNEIHIPRWHGWDIFATGGEAYGHTAPGPGNLLYGNDTLSKTGDGALWDGLNTIYTFTDYGAPTAMTESPPSSETFYPVKWEAP